MESPILLYGSIPAVMVCPGPADWYGQPYLAHELVARDCLSEAWEIQERAWSLVTEAMNGRSTTMNVVNLAARRSQLQLSKGLLGAAVSTLEQAWCWGAEHPNLDFLRGLLHEVQAEEARSTWNRTNHLRQAQARYQWVLHQRGLVFHEQVMPGITASVGFERMGTVLLGLDEAAEALDVFGRCSDGSQQETTGVVLGKAEALVALGRAEEALVNATTIINQHQRQP